MLDFDSAGHPVSRRYRDVYKSRNGAWGEAVAVFVEAAQLRQRWPGRRLFTVLELGFGLGVNFLATLDAWQADPQRPPRLVFVSIESDPLSADELARAHAALAIDHPQAQVLRERWPVAARGVHRIDFLQGAVTLLLAVGDVEQLLGRLDAPADAFFLDGFAPDRNPRMWSARTMRGLARLARPGAVAATYTAAAEVRAALSAAGFAVQALPGFGAKRERTVARFSPRIRPGAPRGSGPGHEGPGERSAIVVGAGLGGCAVAGALGERGWSVQLLEAGPDVATGGSSQPVVADHPHVSSDDNRLARLSRAALSFASAGEHDLGSRGIGQPAPIGRLDLARDPAESERQRDAIARAELPPALVTFLERDQAEQQAGVGLAAGGLWFPGCRAVEPTLQCRQWLEAAAGRVRLRVRTRAARLESRDGRWALLGESGNLLAEAPVVILANAGEAPRLGGQSVPQLRRVRGQTTLLSEPGLAALRTVIGAAAYACPLGDGRVAVGSTFDDGASLAPTRHDDLSNLRRLARALAPVPSGLAAILAADATAWPADLAGGAAWPADLAGATAWPAGFAGARQRPPGRAAASPWAAQCRSGPTGFRWVTRDRIPMIGALPDEAAVRANAAEHARDDRLALPRLEGVYGAFAFGSRGLLWARLAAQVLGAMLEGEPLALETDLLASIDPSRFLRQAARRARL